MPFMSINFCIQCEEATSIVIDFRRGEKNCSVCGSILKSNFINQNLKTRYSVESNKNMSEWDKGFKLIVTMADTLGLTPTVKDRAQEIYNNPNIRVYCRGRSLNAIMVACFFIASREMGQYHTLKELSSVVANGVIMKDIYKAMKNIRKYVAVDQANVEDGQFVEWFCSKLGMEKQAMKAVKEAFQEAGERLDIRRNPKSILAAIICMVIQISEHPLLLQEIIEATEVAEITIRRAYKDICPHASKILPKWYVGEKYINLSLEE